MASLLYRFKNATGWRKTAGILTAVMATVAVITSIILIVTSTKAGGIHGNYVFNQGSCTATNMFMHLLINLLATGVLASSNFFMQILNAPSRTEIDRAHAKNTFIDIGVQSFRNLRFMATWKVLIWSMLALSSVPLHLFANSTVFQSHDIEPSYDLAMVSEGFVNGALWYAPGASLRPNGNSRSRFVEGNADDSKRLANAVEDNVQSMALRVGGWKRLTAAECRSKYLYSGGLREYRDVVLVIRSPEAAGWKRQEVFSGNTSIDRLWDNVIPPSKPNSLWTVEIWCEFGTSCGDGQGYSVDCHYMFGVPYLDRCLRAGDDATLPAEWKFNYVRESEAVDYAQTGFNKTLSVIQVEYCLAQPFEDNCKVAVSNLLLTIVLTCILVKLVCCCFVYFIMDSTPLVTPGDAISSFIRFPDDTTRGMCTFGLRDFDNLSRHSMERQSPQAPRKWVYPRSRWLAAIPIPSLVLTYMLFVPFLGLLMFYFIRGVTRYGLPKEGLDRYSLDSIMTMIPHRQEFILSTFVANIPQLALSICYQQYNSLFTRMMLAREWASYSQIRGDSFQGLRVTAPIPGSSQVATWRLQLPYRCGLPLMGMSALLHWLVSNCSYVLLEEGGSLYGKSYRLPGFQKYVAINTGYSLHAMLVVLILTVLVALFPLALGMKRLPGDIPVAGSCSMAISAACHVPAIIHQDQMTSSQRSLEAPQTDIEMQALLDSTNDQSSSLGEKEMDKAAILESISRGPLRWGVVDRGEEFDGDPVGHLSFGKFGQVVGAPVRGKLYR